MSQCIHSEVLKWRQKGQSAKEYGTDLGFFNHDRTVESKEGSIASLPACSIALEITTFRINISLEIWLQISVLLDQEELILFLLL